MPTIARALKDALREDRLSVIGTLEKGIIANIVDTLNTNQHKFKKHLTDRLDHLIYFFICSKINFKKLSYNEFF